MRIKSTEFQIFLTITLAVIKMSNLLEGSKGMLGGSTDVSPNITINAY